MAFKKSLQLNNGYSVEYWRVTKAPSDKLKKKDEVIVSGYKDEATSRAGGKPLTSKRFEVSTDGFNFSGYLFEQSYLLIKYMQEPKILFREQPPAFFADAEKLD